MSLTAGISVLRGYGFIQYESEEEGRAAVAAEHGVMLKGQRIGKKNKILSTIKSLLFQSLGVTCSVLSPKGLSRYCHTYCY